MPREISERAGTSRLLDLRNATITTSTILRAHLARIFVAHDFAPDLGAFGDREG